MSVWSWLDGGNSQPAGRTVAERLVNRVGLAKARRHRAVSAPGDCRIHPDARIHPRSGQITFGHECLVAPDAIIQGSVSFGDHCSVQSFAVVVGYGETGLVIGNGVRIAPHAMLIGANHNFAAGEPIHGQGLTVEPIVVEDDVWIAGRATITAGVIIGAGSVVAAGAVVTRDVPAGSVVAGVPAKVIRQR